MKWLLVAVTAVISIHSAHATDLGCVSTTFHLASPNDKICVTAYTDPLVPAVTCYLSQARTGGYAGAVGLAEDPSRFSVACTATQPVFESKDRSALSFSKTVCRLSTPRRVNPKSTFLRPEPTATADGYRDWTASRYSLIGSPN